MKSKETESWRKRYIRLLSGPGAATDAQEDLQAMQDLIDAGYLRAEALTPMGVVSCIGGVMLPTLTGRLFVEDQVAFLKSKTFFGRIKSGWPIFSGLICAVVGWALALFTPLIQHQLQPPVPVQQMTNSRSLPLPAKPSSSASPSVPATP